MSQENVAPEEPNGKAAEAEPKKPRQKKSKWSEKAQRAFARVEEQMRNMDAQYFVCSHGGQVAIVRYATPDGKPLDENNIVLDFMAKGGFYLWLNHKRIIVPGREKDPETNEMVEVFREKKLAEYWLERWTSDNQRYRWIGCFPYGAKSDVWNTWTGLGIEPAKGDWSKLRWHIYHILAEDEKKKYGDYIIKWLAWMAQNLDVPAEVVLTFLGKKGCGKGTLGTALCRMIGRHHAQHIASSEYFLGRFNEHLRDCIFLFADEAFWAGDKKGEGKLKQMVTEPTINVEVKFKPLRTVKNMLHIMIASNEGWVIPAGPQERRYAAFLCDNRYAEGMPGQREYFRALRKEMAHGGLAAMLYDLQNMDLKGWHPRDDIPQTRALKQQKTRSEDEVFAVVRELLEDGELPAGGHVERLGVNEAFKDAVISMLPKNKQEHRFITQLGQLLTNLGVISHRFRWGPSPYQRDWKWTFPPLEDCRRIYDATYEWPMDRTEWERPVFPEEAPDISPQAPGAKGEPEGED